jgi:phosphoribosylamine--glycine ligase
MGAYSPAPVMTDAMNKQVMDRIIRPTVNAMAACGAPYQGVLYAGLMITEDGPQLIEYNVRFGDPETQVLMMRLAGDIVPALMACATGGLEKQSVEWRDEAALTVVMAASGYPGPYEKGSEIRGLEQVSVDDHVEVFHAGTSRRGGRVFASGGRVLNVTARGHSVADAQQHVYAAIDRIDWPEGFCRRDIGWRAIKRES